jgi:hypothetical protein
MTHTLRVKRLRGSSIFKLILIGHVIGLTLLCGVFSVPAVFGVEILSWNGEYITGPLALVMGPSGSSLAAEKEINPGRWAKNLPSDTRFTVLTEFNNEAVRDNNTGLVWQITAGDTSGDSVVALADRLDWYGARLYCLEQTDGGVRGWRLPSVHELSSLLVSAPGVGHLSPPFFQVQSSGYWSATTDVENPTFAWYVGFNDGDVDAFFKTGNRFVWCVRGGGPLSAYLLPGLP